ncbi:hypothetical protein [Brumicola pallidula]|uniref:Uncharacterized protein n=1 Tax=Brumicola pallidula DSM 14239 = ACAM 615 TaxID=1121922 RepID=K6YX88_9ALTE|nr:hypothetical protein [Glaciecola pallidula]GAC28611.1 hypothetical protein GPAL_1748 [Glaciecola pallidula DSM 14239 = ACAM 615]
MSIIQNAIDSIQIGVEDFESDDDRRSVSAVRNITAGILLLYKEKLCQLSPDDNKELLIKQHIRPVKIGDGKIGFEGKGNKTVDVISIKERFKSLNITVVWNRFDEISNLRNDLEHYYTSKSPDAVREIVTKSFLLIRDFLSEHLELDPQETLGNDCWTTLLKVSDVYLAEEKACKATIDAVDWKYDSVESALEYLRSNQCHSSLIQAPYQEDLYPTIDLRCKSCGHDFCFDDALEQCIYDSFASGAIRNAMDGGYSPFDTCNECRKRTFIHADAYCVACGYEMEYISCENCEESLTLDDQCNEGKCSSCQYEWEKIMAE